MRFWVWCWRWQGGDYIADDIYQETGIFTRYTDHTKERQDDCITSNTPLFQRRYVVLSK